MRNKPARFTVLICAASEQPGVLPGVVVYPQLPPRSNLTIDCYVADTRLLDLDAVVLGFLDCVARAEQHVFSRQLSLVAAIDIGVSTFYSEFAPLLGSAVAAIEVPQQFEIVPGSALENALPKAVSRAKYYRALRLQAQGEGG